MMKRLFYFFPVLLSLVVASCDFFGERIEGNGNIKTEVRTVDNFSGVDVSSNMIVHITQGPTSSVKVEADENLLAYIEVRTNGDMLEIRPRDNANLHSSRGIKLYVSSPEFKVLHASGACEVFGDTKIVSKDLLDIDLSGASHMTLDLNAPRVKAGISGASSVNLTGQTKDLRVDASGASELRGYELMTETVEADLSGACNTEIYVSGSLKANLSGASHIRYKGNATVNQSTSGASSVSKKD
jgi:hypothetical protein